MIAETDEELAHAAAAGDRDAFAALILRHHERIFRIALTVLGGEGARAEAEDVAQDVCAALPRKLLGFDGRAALTTWLYRVTVNAARDRLRQRTRQTALAWQWAEREVLIRDGAAARQEEQAWLEAALASLDEDLRETVALVVGEDLTHAQAAEVLGISPGTVSWRMSEVRRRLRQLHLSEDRT